MDRVKIGRRASHITITANFFLCIFKIIAAIVGKSSAMLADAFHSLADILTTAGVLLGLKLSNKEADQCHPYGHEKYEPIIAKVMSAILILTGIAIGYNAIKSIIHNDYSSPGKIALVAAGVSIVFKEFMYHYTKHIAKKIKSIAMEADAWHHRSDSLSSIGAFIGIWGARMGIRILDPLAGLLVSLLIIKVGVEFYLKAIEELVDHAADERVVENITRIAYGIDGVESVKLKTRIFGNKLYADILISVDGSLSIEDGCRIATSVHNAIEEEIEDIKHCVVELEPYPHP
ncbi:cation diffusion facilitator family transporter [Alkaliphilus serpentinus]|uniref:Cation transporter n=1 Tax=Alkaliphilus serpentinus TaxID=1482731 RepID=A0A833HPN4_9FIRM|nr:cation diffusion facilitator family transporter [Alkaliphilus serpentinus]KAB3531094.1 cation transporter [Alkaliphilus serpentinus]